MECFHTGSMAGLLGHWREHERTGTTQQNARGKMERSSDSTLSDRRKRARKIIINPYADFAFTTIFFVEARRTECHGAASAMMP